MLKKICTVFGIATISVFAMPPLLAQQNQYNPSPTPGQSSVYGQPGGYPGSLTPPPNGPNPNLQRRMVGGNADTRAQLQRFRAARGYAPQPAVNDPNSVNPVSYPKGYAYTTGSGLMNNIRSGPMDNSPIPDVAAFLKQDFPVTQKGNDIESFEIPEMTSRAFGPKVNRTIWAEGKQY
jgi:hypothetical protein